MDSREAKLALARKKLKDHQDKKSGQKEDGSEVIHCIDEQESGLMRDADDFVDNCQKDSRTETNQNIEEHKHKDRNLQETEAGLTVTEILISNKRNLEMQVTELQKKSSQLEYSQTLLDNDNYVYKQQINELEKQIKLLNNEYLNASEQLKSKDKNIKEIISVKSSLSDENANLQEQLEFTKNMLTAKETENASLHSHLGSLQNQLELTQLQLQQLTTGSHTSLSQKNYKNNEGITNADILMQKISNLENQLSTLQKDKDQINSHYEHYVNELNEQLKSSVTKNDELMKELQVLSNREYSLIEQIGDMEIRLQKYITRQESVNNQGVNVHELQQEYQNLQVHFQDLNSKFNELQNKYTESEAKVKELSNIKPEPVNDSIPISISRLNADIASDKVAIQRATEQNKKLKIDLQELEEAFVKISKDKLELTEKLDAEKFLNRELTIKLAEVEDKAKDLHTKLIAKDEEMIRLQSSYRDIKTRFDKLLEVSSNTVPEPTKEIVVPGEHLDMGDKAEDVHQHNIETEDKAFITPKLVETRSKIPKEDAMLKLQDRFLKIMDEVANLSDEKHRLEHIILQLQNETDTICEYVALYQQQRSLLKKRDEERSEQIKIFQSECELLKNQLDELSSIITKISQDGELSTYFEDETRNNDLAKILSLLSNLKHSSVLDPKRECSELKDFYPCGCCSGKLIDV